MEYGHTIGEKGARRNAEEVRPDGQLLSAAMWAAWTIPLVIVLAAALICVPFVVVWCLLFDAD